MFNSCERAGAGPVWLIEESRAAGIGAGLPVSEPLASMICDIGGGTTEVAVMSLGDVVASRSIRVAGDAMDAAMVSICARQYSLRTGEYSAEQLKIHIGSAAPLDHELSREISGLDTASGVPRKAVVTSEEFVNRCMNHLNVLSMQFVAQLKTVSRNWLPIWRTQVWCWPVVEPYCAALIDI